ncbi:MAG: AAA family ATPase [Gemmatimonadota bacterium]|uniref:DNA polymerase III subunit n=1 Tax=Candidatus Palauibacter scopulicola TaxID=3056741 RepID=UPI0023A16D59|nr:NACHT domain-containing protein [Candidatus Palauibacter scopulicola]MDE2664443.1 AAA family ATPase [Candidatus Palauibacter scopulicola]
MNGERPWGQEDLLRRLAGAVAGRRLPQSLLVHGPEGVGKRTLALWLARALQCEAVETGDGPCEACRSCRMAARLEHPDIHFHFPMPRPKRAASRAKLREAIETQRHERLALLREDLHARLDPDAVTGLYVAAVENIRDQASRRPAMTRRSVFVIEDAERMVPQSASPEAANAFLKLLEEPPPFAYIVLTSSRPDALLPTIRSRTVPLRVAPLPTERVAAYVAEHLGVDDDDRARGVARRAGGAVYRARTLVDAEAGESEAAADGLLAAALDGTPQARYRAASRYSARGARGELEPALEALRIRLRDMLCVAAGAADAALDPGRTKKSVGAGSRDARGTVGGPAEGAVLEALGAVDAAVEGVGRNLNPQATTALLLEGMSAAFAGRSTGRTAGTPQFAGVLRSL